jgi:hypothetical protein
MDRNLMAQIITTYLLVVLLVSLGFFGVGALASAQELRDPMQPPPFAQQKYRETKNDTVREVMDLTREVYGYEFKQNNAGYIVLPRSGIEWGYIPVDQQWRVCGFNCG